MAMALAFVFAASPARAQATPAPSDREAQRTDIYKQAVDLANAGHWEEAEGKLQEVLAIRASPKARFTLGQAQEHVGQLAEAYDSYQQAMNEAQLTGQAEVTRVAGPALQALESRVPVLRLVVSGTSASGASATIDDRPALLDRSVRVDPGAHRVSVSAPGARTATNSVTLAEGQHLDSHNDRDVAS